MEDRAGDGWAPGGPSLYAARMAATLGAHVRLVTRLPASYPLNVFAGIDVIGIAAPSACRYANSYDAEGNRTQLLLHEGEPLAMPPGVVACDVLIVAPAYHELAALPGIEARVVGVSLQGALRTVDAKRRVRPHPEPRRQAEPFVRPSAFTFLSEEDTPAAEGLGRWIAKRGGTAVVTLGYRGATIISAESSRHLAAVPATPVEPTGAGDCFATAFLVAFAETGDLDEASRFALAAGAIAVERPGLLGVATREEIESRLARVAV